MTDWEWQGIDPREWDDSPWYCRLHRHVRLQMDLDRRRLYCGKCDVIYIDLDLDIRDRKEAR